jgi:hypothetical protein
LFWAATRQGPVRLSDLIHTVYPMFIVAIVIFSGLLISERQLTQMGPAGLVLALAGSYAATMGILACWPEGNRVLRGIWALRTSFRRSAA